MHCFTISICEAAPNFNESLMTPMAFMKSRGTTKLEQLKLLEFENTRNVTKSCSQRKKKNNLSHISYIPTKGIYLQRLPRLLTSQMNQLLGVIFQL